jgi:hypothetical protein
MSAAGRRDADRPQQNAALKDIVSSTFRANPSYTLEAVERLSLAEQQSLKGQAENPEFYGILRPCAGSGLGIKLISREMALLFGALKRPGTLPSHVSGRLGTNTNEAIAALVLDGVLQLESGRGFVSGAACYSRIFRRQAASEPKSRLAALSLAAVRYAENLKTDNVSELSMRLYLYNRIPATPRWRAEVPDSKAVRGFLGIGSDSTLNRDLERHWILHEESPTSAESNGWLSWRSRSTSKEHRAAGYMHKLYISPEPNSLPDAFSRTVTVLTEIQAPAFKIGNTLEDLLRPDKLVAYFGSHGEMMEAAERIVPALHGISAQGVPFTASVGGDGLVSWGVDPPVDACRLAWEEPESWRLWITNRLAIALASTRILPLLEVSASEFAIQRLRIEGVDTNSWAPSGLEGAA